MGQPIWTTKRDISSWDINAGYQVCVLDTPADGNCLFHAICNSMFIPYRLGTINDKPIDRYYIVRELRRDLSKLLRSVDSTGVSYYKRINKGNMELFSTSVPEFTIDSMVSVLDSSNPLGYGFLDFICTAINIDIYILDSATKSIYVTDELPYIITGSRQSIVLNYTSGHYESVALVMEDGSLCSSFDPSNQYIKNLNSHVRGILDKIVD